MDKKDYYEVLGVSKTATDEEIERLENLLNNIIPILIKRLELKKSLKK